MESRFVTKDDLVPFRCSTIPSSATPVSVGGAIDSTRNGCHDTCCPSARRLEMVRKDTGAHSEGTVCVRTAANEAIGSTTACRMM
ncbi:hypothetical protein TNCV_4947911 [Trichonephila clavipes]|nr:hypothetical protein TNCV_4947911 [Trichonephila clavipes]